MAEWHIPPDYIVDHWTDELFDLMVGKLIERKERETGRNKPSSDAIHVTDKEHMAMLGKQIRVETK